MENNSTNSALKGLVLFFLFLSITIYIGRVHELVGGLEKLSPAKIIMVTTFVLFLAIPNKDFSLLSNNLTKIVLYILLLAVINVPFSIYVHNSIDGLTGTQSKNFIFFMLIVAIVSKTSDLNKVVFAILVSVLLLSIATLLAGGTEIGGIERAAASDTYDPNDVAFVIVTFLPLVYFQMRNSQGIIKLMIILVIAVMLSAFVATASRGGLIGLVSEGVIISYKNSRKRGIVFSIFTALTISVAFLAMSPAGFKERMDSIFHPMEDYNMTSSSGRVEVWKRGLLIMATHPLGVGIGNFSIAEGRMHEGKGKWSAPHNSFIQIGAELGPIGLFLFLMLLRSSVRAVKNLRRLDKEKVLPEWLPEGLEVSFYGYIVTAFFLSHAYSPVLLILVAITAAAGNIVERSADKAPAKRPWE